jgi:hypothetical protein
MDIPPNDTRLRSQPKRWLISAIVALLAVIAVDIRGELARAGDSVRVTTSFDVKYASGVLKQVSKLYSSGFGQPEISRVEQDINALKPDQPKVWQFNVQYKGKPQQLEIRALLDDLGMIDLDFAAGADSAPAVRAAIDSYLAGRGG